MREDIKEMLKNCNTEDEAAAILEDINIEITENELDNLRGGTLILIECGIVTERLIRQYAEDN